MNRFRPIIAFAFALLATALPASAASAIQDGAGLFSAATVSQLDAQLGDFTAQTGKQIVVVTVPSLNGKPLADAAQAVFSEQQINGVLLFIAKDDRKDIIVPGQATAQFFPEPTIVSIRQSMESQFRDGDFDGGIATGVTGILNVFRAHEQSASGAGSARSYPAVPATTYVRTRQGAHFSMFGFLLLIGIGYLVLRSIFRAMSGPRSYGAPGPGMGGPGGPGYGDGYGGYGPGYGGYGGGGSFFSGLLGGLGGAWLGSEMFGNRGTTIIDQTGGGNVVPTDAGGSWGGGDAGGWGNDAGQADMGGSSGGDFSGGGFGDFGGGGGFGGGDSGGGW
jgi:uncharacterized protein